jgi:hypothetical protein
LILPSTLSDPTLPAALVGKRCCFTISC